MWTKKSKLTLLPDLRWLERNSSFNPAIAEIMSWILIHRKRQWRSVIFWWWHTMIEEITVPLRGKIFCKKANSACRKKTRNVFRIHFVSSQSWSLAGICSFCCYAYSNQLIVFPFASSSLCLACCYFQLERRLGRKHLFKKPRFHKPYGRHLYLSGEKVLKLEATQVWLLSLPDFTHNSD